MEAKTSVGGDGLLMQLLALTTSQKKILDFYECQDGKELKFPPYPQAATSCSRLEGLGFLEGDLIPARWDSRTRITDFKRGYRITNAARTAIAKARNASEGEGE